MDTKHFMLISYCLLYYMSISIYYDYVTQYYCNILHYAILFYYITLYIAKYLIINVRIYY